MNEYHKIQTVFKRDPTNEFKTLLIGQYACPEFEYLRKNTWVYTEKVDGTNIRIMWDSTLAIGGKTEKAQMQPPMIEWFEQSLKPKEKLFAELFPDAMEAPVCLYGEGFGPKIQKGGKYTKTHGVILFDIKIGHWWLKRADVEELAAKLGLPTVPIIGLGTLEDMVDAVRGGIGSAWGDFPAEGIVARPAVELRARSGQRIITKIKHRDFERY